MRIILCFLLLIASTASISAQDSLKVLDHADFLHWKTLQDQQISADGGLIAYRLVPGEGDPMLYMFNKQDSTSVTVNRASKYSMDYEGNFLFGLITPHRDSLRTLERKKVEKKNWPSDTLFIYDVRTKQFQYIPFVTEFKTPDKLHNWLAYTVKKEGFPSDTTKKDKKGKKEIVHLVVHELNTGRKDTLQNVKEYTWAEKAPVLLAIAETSDSIPLPNVNIWKANSWKVLIQQKGEYAKPSLSPDGLKAAFVANHDTTKALVPPWELYYYDENQYAALPIAQKDNSTLPVVSHHVDMRWSDDNRYLYYGRGELPAVKDTTLLDDESVQVEIWRTDDPVLYTMQNVNKAGDEKKSYAHVYDTQLKKHTALHTPAWESISFTRKRDSRYALLHTEKPYQLSVTWLGDAAKDLAVVDIQTGKITPFKNGIITNPRLSPGGKYVYGYSEADTTWWVYHIVTGVFSNLNTKGLPSFYDEQHDLPGLPNSYGAAGWTANDDALILNDRYDLWKWSPLQGRTPKRITKGREEQKVHRYIHTDPENEVISVTGPWLIHTTDDRTKSSGYSWLTPADQQLHTLYQEPYAFSRQVMKARKQDTYLFKRENFHTFPDLEISDDKLKSSQKISDANPQQNGYKWGTIEIYEWMDWDSVMRKGLLVKPQGFDTLRSYPMIVNFYERYTDQLHHHPNIEPHRSTINYAFYASRGYVIFNPDISYKVGYPGESAHQIVMSGTMSLVKKRVADPNNMGLQGHSWGGYQNAYIVTRTDIFKCAEAGAAVVNMTSAYGGIRWGTGLARMFQYEKTQSRLGKSLWEDPNLYIENSPLFKIDKINTPLLLMHNDEDAAVPFEQGIEFYLALRRLGKKAWLLNYVGEPHWPVKWHNKKDFQLRMSQFFDHYLKGAPMPRWMVAGVPAMQRGIDPGY